MPTLMYILAYPLYPVEILLSHLPNNDIVLFLSLQLLKKRLLFELHHVLFYE